MNPKDIITNQPDMNLPEPIAPESAQQRPEAPVKQQGTERNPELLPASQASAPIHQQAVGQLPQAQPAAPGHIAPTQPKNSGGSVAAGTPAIAEDADLIEKEWVQKAKSIVAQTREDPHKQNEEISAVKTDYIKKRYNKEVPTSEQP